MRIAIDGPAGAGKTDVGRALAKHMALPFLDTGLMYRAVAARALRQKVAFHQRQALGVLARQVAIHSLKKGGVTEYFVRGISPAELRSKAVEQAVSQFAAQAEVRSGLATKQRAVATNGIVMVGRDIGTVILNSADLKLYLDAPAHIRAQRRRSQIGSDTVDGTLSRMQARDGYDSARELAPLKPAPDAVVMNTAGISLATLIERVCKLAQDADITRPKI